MIQKKVRLRSRGVILTRDASGAHSHAQAANTCDWTDAMRSLANSLKNGVSIPLGYPPGPSRARRHRVTSSHDEASPPPDARAAQPRGHFVHIFQRRRGPLQFFVSRIRSLEQLRSLRHPPRSRRAA